MIITCNKMKQFATSSFLFHLFSSIVVIVHSQKSTFPYNWSPSEILPPNYNSQQPPNVNGRSVEVRVNLFVLSFHRLVEADQSFRIDVFLHMMWTDHRLTLPRNFNQSQKLVMGSMLSSQIWLPHLNFRNARSTTVVNSIVPSLYATLNNRSEIFMSAKMTLDLNCNMDFSKYPFDSQRCLIDISSLSYTNDLVELHWGNFTLTKNLYLPQFRVVRESISTEELVIKYDIGSFSCLRGRFRLDRNIGNFIVSRYIPSFLIVLLTFAGFWIPTHAYPARVGLCITGLLSLITQQYQNVLNVSYVYSLNVWMMICIVFVFGTVIEYAFAISDWSNYVDVSKRKYVVSSNVNSNSNSINLVRRRERSTDVPTAVTSSVATSIDEKLQESKWKEIMVRFCNPTDRNNSVDMVSRLLFPISYFIVTIIYFLNLRLTHERKNKTSFGFEKEMSPKITSRYKNGKEMTTMID